MIDSVRELLERDLARVNEAATRQVQMVRQAVVASYLTLICLGVVTFVLLFFALRLAARHPDIDSLIVAIGMVCAVAVTLLAELLRADQRFIRAASNILTTTGNWFRRRLRQDFLVRHYWASIGLLWAPFCTSFVAILLRFEALVRPGSPEFERQLDSLRQIATFSGAVLAAQLTLITFLSSSMLGRYSSLLATALVKHPAVVSLLLFSLTLVLGSTMGLVAGYPDAAVGLLPLFFLLAFACLGISVGVVTSGISTDRAIEYAGHRFGNRIRRIIKAPLKARNFRRSFLRRTLAATGFYLRDPDRMLLLQPSPTRLVEVERYLMALFNAASKAVQEEQQEVLRASLQALVDCASAYSEKRRHYAGSQDEVFRLINQQLAATMKAAASASNEGLVADVVAYAGVIGSLSLRIGTVPSSLQPEENGRKFVSRSHPLATFWIGLLKSGFYFSHTLQHSTAPSTAIREIGRLAGIACKLGYDEVVRFVYLPTMQELHSLCFISPDAYHIDLSGQCAQNVLTVWFYAAVVADAEAFHETHEAAVETISRMGFLHMQHGPQLVPFANISDITSVLTARLDVEHPILLDIFLLVGRRQNRERWESRARVKQLESLMELLTSIGSEAVDKRRPLATYYCQAFYEMAYCILFMNFPLPGSEREALEASLFESWEAMVPTYYNGYAVSIQDWEHPMFGVIGLGMAAYERRPTATLKKQLQSCARLYFELVKDEEADKTARMADDAWDYLQLVGAWARTFLADKDLSDELAQKVANGRPFSSSPFGLGSSSREGRYGSVGYPTTLFGDYSLPQLINIGSYLTEGDFESLQRVQHRLFCDETLLPFAQEVRTIRQELRKQQESRSQVASQAEVNQESRQRLENKPGLSEEPPRKPQEDKSQ